jgi:hypothetical protein
MSFTIFTPIGATVNIAATGTSGAVALSAVTNQSRSVRVRNKSAVEMFIEFGASTVAATLAASVPVGPGATEWFEIGGAVTHVAAITEGGTGTIYFTEGRGS